MRPDEIRGMDVFCEAFEAFTDQLVCIGGVACAFAFAAARVPFRATKDFDLVIHLQEASPAFVRAWWDFINAGGYARKEASENRRAYRFTHPSDDRYPKQLELFCGQVDALAVAKTETGVIMPIPSEEDDLSDLSAIVMDPVYYEWLLTGSAIEQDVGLRIAQSHVLFALKANAWRDHVERQAERRHTRKHIQDALGLVDLWTARDPPVAAPAAVVADIEAFLNSLAEAELPPAYEEVDLEPLKAAVRRRFGLGG